MGGQPVVGIRIQEDLKFYLQEKAMADGRTMSSLINKILREWAEKERLKEK